MSELPPGWAHATLTDLIGPGGLFTDGDWVETKDQDASGAVRLTQLADVGDGYFRDRSRRYLRDDQADRLNCTYLTAGDVLVARMPDPLGRACLFPGLPQAAVTAVDVCIVRPGEQSVDSRWLMWAINSPHFRARVDALQTGTTRKRISRKNLASIPLPLPPLAEQRRIVAAIEEQFSRLDAVEQALVAATRRAESLRRACLAAACGRDTPSRMLGDVAETQLGKMLSTKSKVGDRPQPYLRNKSVQWYRVDVHDLPTMDFSETERAKFKLRPGDVLVCEGGEVGRSAIWRGELSECYFQKALHRVRPGPELDGDFLVHVLKWFSDRDAFDSYVTGSTIKHLPQEDFRRLPIPLPPLEDQRRIVAELEQQLSLIDSLRAAVESAQRRSVALRGVILERAFRGELVPQDPADEPASVFLERIRAERAATPKAVRKPRARSATQ